MARPDVLVLRRGGLGDTLLLVPLLRGMRRRWPDARLTVVGVAEFAELLSGFGACDAARSIESSGAWALAAGGDAAEVARRRFGGFAAVYADQALPGIAPPVTVFDPRGFAPGVPFGLWLASACGVAVEWPGDARLDPPAGIAVGGATIVAPGSGGAKKCWPRERWLAFAARCLPGGRPLRVLVGPAEAERDDPRRWPWPGPVEFVADRSPIEVAHELASARVFVGNDSGPTHLAALLGVPTVVLFGPSDPSVWAPVGPHVHVVRGPGEMAGLAVGPVLEAWQRAYGSCPRTRLQ